MARRDFITVKSNAREVSARFRRLARDQMPFATAKALSFSALQARNAVRTAMPRRFKIRSQRVIQGIISIGARKRDWPNTHAIVASRDKFMVLQELGGVKRARGGGGRGGTRGSGGGKVAVPTKFITRRRTGRGTIPKPWKPRRAIASKKAYVAGGSVIRKRPPKRKGRSRARNLALALYLLVTRAKIRPVFRFRETVVRSVGRTYAPSFRRWIIKGVATRR